MKNSRLIRLLLAAVALALCPASSALAAGKTEKIRVFSKPVFFTYTAPDGSVTHQPSGPPEAGSVLEIDFKDFLGDHTRHAKRSTISEHLRCEFSTPDEADCFSWVAIGGSLLRWHNDTLLGGTGRYQGATGKVLKNQEVKGGSDVVVRVTRR